MSSAIDLDDRAKTVVEDYDAIRDVVQMCLDGEATGNVEKLRTAFHEDAHVRVTRRRALRRTHLGTHGDVGEGTADTGQYWVAVLSVHQSR